MWINSSVDRLQCLKESSQHFTHAHCPFSLVVILALLFVCVQKFQTMLVFQLWVCDEAPLPTYECGKLPLWQNVILIAILKMTKQS